MGLLEFFARKGTTVPFLISYVAGLTNLIDNFNSTQANQATPAGKVLIANGVMSLAQLQALGGVSPVICPPPPTSQAGCTNSPGSQVDFGWLRATDLKLAWRHTIKERFTIEPSVGIFNLFNFAMFNQSLLGTVFGSASPRVQIPNLIRLYQAGQLEVDELVTHEYSLDEVQQGYEDLAAGLNIRGVVKFDI